MAFAAPSRWEPIAETTSTANGDDFFFHRPVAIVTTPMATG